MADKVYNLKFTLSNGDVIDAGQITAPQGPKGDKGDSADIPYSSSTPFMDGVGSAGSANTVARGDHRHPSDTSRQEKLVSGTNIKTINGQSVLGSGDISISGGGTIDADTLNGLMFGGNGISSAITNSGSKVQVALDLPNIDVTAATGIMTLTADASYTASSPVIKAVLKNNPASYTTIGSGKISVHDSGYGGHLDITGVDISVYDGDMDTTYYFLNSGNTKKIYGKSIYGFGNIDLYRHIVWIKNDTSGHQIYVTVHIISSSNTVIDSLTDLFSVLNSYRNTWYPCNGRVNITGYKGVAYNFQPVSDGAVAFFGTDGDEHFYTWSQHTSGLTLEDTVTTV